MKVFLIDVNRCNGCYCCQLACKDEHCNQAWLPYAEEQPLIGQFWLRIHETERGKVPMVRVSYIPEIGSQTEAIRHYAPEVLIEREDGLIVLDPEKSKGRKDLAEKFDGVFWNEKLEICQGCTGCAHLLDSGDHSIPRCVDACPTEALRFGDSEQFDLADATQVTSDSHVYYLNYPKRFIGGLFYDSEEQEVIIGADVALCDFEGNKLASMKTDEFGDFKFDQIDAAAYQVEVHAEGYNKAIFDADVLEKDVYIGDVALVKNK